jgi:hypothetical protein
VTIDNEELPYMCSDHNERTMIKKKFITYQGNDPGPWTHRSVNTLWEEPMIARAC